MDKIALFVNDIKISFKDADISSNSAKISYYMIFSIFPFILTLLNVASFTGLTSETILTNITDVLPDDTSNLLLSVLQDINNNSNGLLFIFSIALGIFSASRGVLSIIQSINEAYRLEETRNFVVLNLLSLAITVFLMVAIILSMFFMIFTEYINGFLFNYLHLSAHTIYVINLIKNIMIACILIFVFSILYRFSPNYAHSQKHHLLHALPGAVFATVSWLIASLFFGIYINKFGNYNKTYGSIGSVIITLLWMNISAMILLTGGLINASARRTLWIHKDDIK